MELLIKGKNLEIPDAVRRYAQRKISKLNRYLQSIAQGEIEFSRDKTKSSEDRWVVQVTLNSNGTLIRGEEKAAEAFSAIDAVHDALHKQIERYKTRLYSRSRGPLSHRAWPALEEGETEAAASSSSRVVRIKRFAMKPMFQDEAVGQMELLGHDFFLFFNAATEEFNVIYRRNDGDYGLICPEIT